MSDVIHTKIWQEEAEPDNPFATRAAYCHGYDVYGEMLGQARWVEMLYLLFKGERPTLQQADLLEALAVALANPGPRDPSVHAAMCGGVGGSTAAASLMAALAVGAGGLGGGREVFLAMEAIEACGNDLDAWRRYLLSPAKPTTSIWPSTEHIPGYDPHGISVATVVCQTLKCLAGLSPGPHLAWLESSRNDLESITGIPIAFSGVAAAAFADLRLSAADGEMLYLLLRLPGAAVHALEQRQQGYKRFPFFEIDLQNDPARREGK